jgi:hypothetical protein
MMTTVEKESSETGQEDGEKQVAVVDAPSASVPWYKFDNVTLAQGYNTVRSSSRNWFTVCFEQTSNAAKPHYPRFQYDASSLKLGMARGAVVMSNIFLASSFIFLASEQAGCLNEEEDEVLDDCDERVYGFKPSSFISNIAIISGVLSALFMPLFGAMIDYTSHRRTVGAVSALCVMLIQAAQIGTVSATWLVMALLQALSGFLYQIQVLAAYAFLPEISRIVGEEKMTKRTCVRWNLVVLSLLILPSHLFVRRYCHLRHGAVCHASILFGRCYCYFLRLGLGCRGDGSIESRR